jgi:hypothetical protein
MAETMTIEEKDDLIIDKIIEERKNSVNTIINQFRNIYTAKMNIRKFFILKHLLEIRNNSIQKIQSHFKTYTIRKKVQNYLSKSKTSFVITTELSDKEDIQLKVYFGNTSINFDFKFDPFLEKLAIFIPRNKIKKKEYNVNFIQNGRIVIDPHYFTTEENGIFVNVINFDRIKKEEIQKLQENEKEIKFLCIYLRELGINLVDGNSSITTTSSHGLKQGKRFASFQGGLNLHFIHNRNLPKPKSILRMSQNQLNDFGKKRRVSERDKLRKVSFGSVQFSY